MFTICTRNMKPYHRYLRKKKTRCSRSYLEDNPINMNLYDFYSIYTPEFFEFFIMTQSWLKAKIRKTSLILASRPHKDLVMKSNLCETKFHPHKNKNQTNWQSHLLEHQNFEGLHFGLSLKLFYSFFKNRQTGYAIQPITDINVQ
jgi:hypothetical protein